MNELLLAMKKQIEVKEQEITTATEALKSDKKDLKELEKMYVKLGGKLEEKKEETANV